MTNRLLAVTVIAALVVGGLVLADSSIESVYATPLTVPQMETAPSTAALMDPDVLARHAEEDTLIVEALVSTTSTTEPSTTTTIATTTTSAAPAKKESSPAPKTTSPPTTAAPTTTAPRPAEPTHDPGAEGEFASSINSYRQGNGLAGLSRSGGLDSYARSWAKRMATDGNLRHSDIGSLLGEWSTVGENVGYGGSVSSVFNALVNSSGHRANMLGNFTHMGVGAYRDANGTLWTAHVFAG